MDMTYNLNGGFKPTTKRFADLDGPDFFPTPAWATHALADNESFEGEIWEPACGNAHAVRSSASLRHKLPFAAQRVETEPYSRIFAFPCRLRLVPPD